MSNSPPVITTTPDQADPRVMARPRRQFWWLRLLAAPIIYAVYFMLAYLAVEAACNTGWLRFTVQGTNGITAAVMGLTVGALVAVLISLLLNAVGWRRRPRSVDAERGDSDRFVLQVAMMLDGLFALIILATGAPALLLAPCAWS